jgi:hypothetical protein
MDPITDRDGGCEVGKIVEGARKSGGVVVGEPAEGEREIEG